MPALPSSLWHSISHPQFADTLIAVLCNFRHSCDDVQMDTMVATPASDMWALGCIAYELLTGKELFAGQSDEEVMSMLIG